MSKTSMTSGQFWAWLFTACGKLADLFEKGKLTLEQLEPVRLVIQAILDNKSVEVVVAGTTAVVQKVSRTAHFLRSLGSVLIFAISGSTQVLAENSGVWFSDNFKAWIANGLELVTDLPEITLGRFQTVKNAYDSEIQAEMSGGYVFENRHVFCAYLLWLILQQLSGKAGTLLTNGYANIFYVRAANGEVVAVNVGWNSDYRQWYCYAYRLDDNQWYGGSRVFSATAA